MRRNGQKYEVPLFRTGLNTSEFEAELITNLNTHLAPRITGTGSWWRFTERAC
jgi:hypothetical protein